MSQNHNITDKNSTFKILKAFSRKKVGWKIVVCLGWPSQFKLWIPIKDYINICHRVWVVPVNLQ